MNQMEHYSEEILDYLSSEMTSLQREAFEKKISGDAALAEEVERQKAILDGIHDRLIYKEAMEDPHYDEADRLAKEVIQKRNTNTTTKPHQNKKSVIFRLIATAAVIAFLFVINRITIVPTPVAGKLKHSTKRFRDLKKLL
jgi:anti-sigma factor RsiW